MILLILSVWWLIGAASFICLLKFIEKRGVTIGDLFLCLLVGGFGPIITTVFIIEYGKEKGYWDHELF